MGGAFDGAGKPNRGPSWRGPIIVLIATLIVIALFWYVYSQYAPEGAGFPPLVPFATPAPTA